MSAGDPSYNDTIDAPEGASASVWDLQMLARPGAPPLRFSGRLMSRDVLGRDLANGYINLWEMRRGGFVLEHSVPTQAPKNTVVISVESLAQACADLECFCAELSQDCVVADVTGQADPQAAIPAIFACQVQNSRIKDFLNLAGTALARWDAWCPPAAPH